MAVLTAIGMTAISNWGSEKMLHNGIKYIGFLAMLIFGGIFIFRWFLRDELLLDQLIGFVVGSILFIVSFFVKRN